MIQNRFLLPFAFLVSICGALICNVQPASAAFNKNNIIDNAIFDNSQTMTVNDIQNFLNGFPNSCLKNYSSPYPNDYFSYGSNVSAARVIRRAADLWGINPQVILTTLEKEQSLVSGGVGCASWQYNSAMGMGCPDGGQCPAPEYRGFSQQVTKGSWLLMFTRQRSEGNTAWNGDGSITYYGRMTAGYRARVQGGATSYYDGYTTIDGSSVYLSNGATASLYTYTPHFHGNQNFDLIFERWFGTTHGTVLLRASGSQTIWLQSGTTRYGIPDPRILSAYGLDKIKITSVSAQYLQSLTNGGTLGTVFKVEGGSAVYLADNGHRFGFATTNQCANWGFPNCLSDAKTLSPVLFNQIRDAGAMKSLMLNGSSVYLMEAGKKRLFFTGTALTENGYSNNDIVPITNALNKSQPQGFSIPQNNTFVSFKVTSVVYIYTKGKFYALNSMDLLRSLLPAGQPIYNDASSQYNSQPPVAQRTISHFVQLSSGKTFMYGNGSKVDISTVASSWPAAQLSDDIATVINAKPVGPTAGPNSTYKTPAGMLFIVNNRQVQPFYSLADYFSSPLAKQPIVVAQTAIASLPQISPYITPGGGSIFQINTQGKTSLIYTLNSDAKACVVTSMSQLSSFKLNTSPVQRLNEFTATSSSLKGLVKATSSNRYYIVHSGTKTEVSQAMLASWGAQTSSLCTFTDNFLGRLTLSQKDNSMKFARTPNGAIYYAKDAKAHQVSSYSSFLRLGGNSQNTMNVSPDFTSYVTVGQPIQ